MSDLRSQLTKVISSLGHLSADLNTCINIGDKEGAKYYNKKLKEADREIERLKREIAKQGG
jgi:hypothetical protein